MPLQTPLLIHSTEYTPSNTPPDLASDDVFRYCRFKNLEANQVDATFLSCVFSKCDFYWTLFNVALFSECQFENCTFAGITFADCLFIECTFVECSFTKGNLGGPCTSENTRWYGCKQCDCTGLKN
jgi:uncharacterized protein YjbI with pentapeptide repeats